MLIVSKSDNEVLNSIKYLFNQERIEYKILTVYEKNCDKTIFITNDISEIPNDIEEDILIISDKRIDLSKFKCKSSEIITRLVDDNNEYTTAQEEYLFRRGIYSIINGIVLDFINDKIIDKLIYDINSMKKQPDNWVFDFDSIAETYAWLNRKNHEVKDSIKVMDLSTPDTYNTFDDSDKEINYLSEYILLAKKGMKISTIFIVTKDVMREKMKNKFLNVLACKCGNNIKTYFCDIDILEKEKPELLSKIRDGINIYDDCVYKDTYSSEITLGIVDCKLESVKEYTDIFNYIKENYSIPLVEDGEYIGI